MSKPLDLARISELLAAKTQRTTTTSTANSYMILRDGSRVPFDPGAVSKFMGKVGKPRKLYPGSDDVVAYKV